MKQDCVTQWDEWARQAEITELAQMGQVLCQTQTADDRYFQAQIMAKRIIDADLARSQVYDQSVALWQVAELYTRAVLEERMKWFDQVLAAWRSMYGLDGDQEDLIRLIPVTKSKQARSKPLKGQQELYPFGDQMVCEK